jgi:hypothetical protein
MHVSQSARTDQEQTTADHFDFAPMEVSDPTVSWSVKMSAGQKDVLRSSVCHLLDPWVEFPGSARVLSRAGASLLVSPE